MCGMAGYVTAFEPKGFTPWQEAEKRLNTMGDAIAHRGPDGRGIWYDEACGVGMVHQRLSILDLSPAGAQPMKDVAERYVLAFNGEIYNHYELRAQLNDAGAAPSWRGHSDTETLLAVIAAWGLERALCAAVGMFAIALWDRERRVLSLARDRFGEKPLYYGWSGRQFFFASELKALETHPDFEGVINPDAVSAYLQSGYVPDPLCIFEGFAKLTPGTLLTLEEVIPSQMPIPQPYWIREKMLASSYIDPFTGTPQQAIDTLEEKLSGAIERQLESDVPLGAFLSGGIDSSAIVALMQANSDYKVATFSIGFEEEEFNEAPYAQAVADHLGTRHTTKIATGEDALDLVSRLPRLYDEPFGDSSAIPMYLVSELAAEHVTVALSGDAGDETFFGYSRYSRNHERWHSLSRFPKVLRHGAAWASAQSTKFVPANHVSLAQLREKLTSAGTYLRASDGWDLYGRSVCHWHHLYVPMNRPGEIRADQHLIEQAASRDILTYLPADILTKIDRAAMAHSLETRVPMLDPELQEFAARLPLCMKMRNGIAKWVLRELLYGYVPKRLLERPKKGFGVPLCSWLRNDLRIWANDLMQSKNLLDLGIAPDPILRRWKIFQRHGVGTADAFWVILMLLAWRAERIR